jgi:hypothetical protein
MRHVKLKPAPPIDTAPLHTLIERAYADIKSLIENG